MLVSFLGIPTIQAQEDQKFFFGINVGAKFANKNYASRYAGFYPNTGTTGNLENVIYQQNNYNQIYTILGEKNFQLPFDTYPTNIRYTPGIVTGVCLGYKLGPSLQFSLDANFSRLKIRDFFTIEVLDPSNTTSQEQYRVGNLYGEESRFNGKFNMDYVVEGETVNIIGGLSGVFHAWRIEEHIAVFEEYIMPLHSKFQNAAQQSTEKIAGTGFGFGINLGAEYDLNEKIVLQLMYQPYVQRADYLNTKATIANLGSSYIKDKYRLEHDLILRIMWK